MKHETLITNGGPVLREHIPEVQAEAVGKWPRQVYGGNVYMLASLRSSARLKFFKQRSVSPFSSLEMHLPSPFHFLAPACALYALSTLCGHAQTVLAWQSFEFESKGSSSTYTYDGHGLLPDGGDDGTGPDVNSSATGNIEDGYWGFNSTLNDTIDIGTYGLADGDFVGVTDYTTTVGAFTHGVQGFEFSDTDDELLLSFDTFDASAFADVTVSFDYFIQDSAYETGDYFKVFINGLAELDSAAMGSGDINDEFVLGEWVSFSFVVNSPANVDLDIAWQSNAADESLYIDNVKITSGVQQATGVLAISPEYHTLDEDDGTGYTVTVTLAPGAPSGGVDVTLAASPAGAVNISSGGVQTVAQGGTTATFTVTPNATSAYMDVPVYFSASTASGYFAAPDNAVLLITNNDAYTPSVPAGYYANATGKAGQPLKDALHGIASNGHSSILYSGGSFDVLDAHRVLFEDPFNSNNIILFYSGLSTGKNDVWFSETTAEKPWSREHLWPQSFGLRDSNDGNNNNDGDDNSDLHALMPVLNDNNGLRGTKYFDDAGSGTAVGLLGAFSESNYFEPPDHHKGDVARALLYMAVRYDGLESLSEDLELAETADEFTYTMAVLSTLEQWHVDDPVSDHERERNDLIYSYQGNRNPFIDHPEYVDAMLNQPDNNGSEQVELIAGTAVGDVLRYNDGGGTSRVVYFNENDTAGQPPAFADASWLPVTVSSLPLATAGVTATLGSVSYQSSSVLTINGQPVYTYTGDNDGDDTTGDGINDEWWTLLADGTSNEPVIVPSSATVLITQYYEGTSFNKWIELTNVSTTTVDLTGWSLTLWSNVTNNENWKSPGGTASASVSLTGYTLNAGDSMLIRHNSATLPSYATADLISSAVINFNGDDSVVLYSGSVDPANIEDVISIAGSTKLAEDKGIIRLSAASGVGESYDLNAGTSFTNYTDVWSLQANNTGADNATSNEELYLGYSEISATSAFDIYVAGFGLTGNDALPSANPDSDDLDNQGEFDIGTDPTLDDTDGDGQSDGAEVLGWLTDPTDPTDSIRPSVSITGTTITVAWESASGVTYVVEENDDLGDALGWSTVSGSSTAGTGGTASTNFTDTDPAKYYRLSVSTP